MAKLDKSLSSLKDQAKEICETLPALAQLNLQNFCKEIKDLHRGELEVLLYVALVLVAEQAPDVLEKFVMEAAGDPDS